MKISLYLCGLSPLFQCNHKKTSDKPQLKDIMSNTSPVLLKTGKVIKNKESLRNFHNQEEPMDVLQLTVIWYLTWDPETKKMDIR